MQMHKLIPVAVWSKAWVCGRSHAGIVGLNSTSGMDVRHLQAWVLCVVSYRGLGNGLVTHAEEYYQVWSRSFNNEEALAHYGQSYHGGKMQMYDLFCWDPENIFKVSFVLTKIVDSLFYLYIVYLMKIPLNVVLNEGWY